MLRLGLFGLVALLSGGMSSILESPYGSQFIPAFSNAGLVIRPFIILVHGVYAQRYIVEVIGR
jgi:hypothetical protein